MNDEDKQLRLSGIWHCEGICISAVTPISVLNQKDAEIKQGLVGSGILDKGSLKLKYKKPGGEIETIELTDADIENCSYFDNTDHEITCTWSLEDIWHILNQNFFGSIGRSCSLSFEFLAYGISPAPSRRKKPIIQNLKKALEYAKCDDWFGVLTTTASAHVLAEVTAGGEVWRHLPIDKLNLSSRLISILNQQGIKTVVQLTECYEKDLLNVLGINKKQIVNIRNSLEVMDLSLMDETNV